jgi:DNA-binding GntR family transcriptional regulator
VNPAGGSSDESATQRVVESLRAMIMHNQLAPGQQIRQDEVSEVLGVSRSPLREALRILETEGLVGHSRNQGYFVVRLNSDELVQVYLMRKLLETEIMLSLRHPAPADLKALEQANAAVTAAVASSSVTEMLATNRGFHFTLFGYSSYPMVVTQVERLWNLSEPLRATYLWMPEMRDRIVAEHEEMISAYAGFDLERLVALADAHRDAARESVVNILLAQEALRSGGSVGVVPAS